MQNIYFALPSTFSHLGCEKMFTDSYVLSFTKNPTIPDEPNCTPLVVVFIQNAAVAGVAQVYGLKKQPWEKPKSKYCRLP